MLSNLIVAKQKIVLIKDELGHERISQKFITQILKEQGEDNNIKILPLNDQLTYSDTLHKFLIECSIEAKEKNKLWNIVLPSLSDLLIYQKVPQIFKFFSKLKKCQYVKRTFLWISLPHLQHDHPEYVVAGFEYMADLVLHFMTNDQLSLLVCKPGGGVTFEYYTYIRAKSEFKVQLKQHTGKGMALDTSSADEAMAEQQGTFKIELDEEEMVARNAMKMPYEKAMEATESNIIYTPDDDDDFDEEDPDEDLNI